MFSVLKMLVKKLESLKLCFHFVKTTNVKEIGFDWVSQEDSNGKMKKKKIKTVLEYSHKQTFLKKKNKDFTINLFKIFNDLTFKILNESLFFGLSFFFLKSVYL